MLRPRHRRFGSLFSALSAVLALVWGAAAPPLAAQTASERAVEAVSGLEFRELGPAVMGGRVADLAVVESDPRIFYVGLGAGGVWKTTSDGMEWDPVFDDQPTSSIGAVSVAPSNPNIVWVGTGEPANRQSSPWGIGVFKSTDAGATWTSMGLEDSRHISRIKIHPTNPDVVYVGAVGHLWGPNDMRGVYRTTDGGATWENVLYIDEDTGIIDLIMDYNDPNTLFAAAYQRRRTAFGFAAGGGGSGLYRSTDGGDTWTLLTEGLPTTEMGRIGLDIYRRDGNLVYAVVEAEEGSGVYRSTDRGETWEMMSNRNPRPMYFSLIRIDPNNPERIYLGGTSSSASDDGGRTWWNRDATENIHVDHHAWWINPHDSNHMINGNDGGLAFSRDGAETWRSIRNMAIGQFYEIDVDMRDPYYVCGGLQDNGNWCAPHRTQATWGVRNGDWTHMWFGDGFHNHSDPTDPNIMYSESQGGVMARIDVASREAVMIRPQRRAEGTEDDPFPSYRFNWNAPFAISRHDPAVLYIGGNHLMRSPDRGQSWAEVSPDLTKALDRDTLPIMGRLVTDETLSRHDGIANNGNITAFAESKHDPDVLYVGTDDGNVQVTRDGGDSWTNVVDRLPNVPWHTYVSGLETSYAEPGRVYVTLDGHRNDDYAAYAFVSEDYGESWRAITNGLPDGWSVNRLREHPRNPDLLFLGNEVGLYMSIDQGASWAHLKNNVPTVAVDDIAIHPRENDLLIGTHGRSIWVLDDITALEQLTTDVLTADATLFGTRRATMWSMGVDWPFQPATFIAPNPTAGAPIRYYLSEPIETMTAEDAEDGDGVMIMEAGPGGGTPQGVRGARLERPNDALQLEILGPDGSVVRTLEPTNEAGLNEVVWDFRAERLFDAPSGGGVGGFFGGGSPADAPEVLPGMYTARLTVNGVAQTSDFEVRLDPRRAASRADLEARLHVLEQIAAAAVPFRDARTRLGAMNSRLDDIKTAVDASELSSADRERVETLAETISEEIEDAEDAIQAAGVLTFASGLEGWSGAPTSDHLWVLEQGWSRLPGAIAQVNTLLNDRMPALEALLEEVGVRPDLGDPIAVPRRPDGLR